jgi:endonuclease YncB( thermonuclease family)
MKIIFALVSFFFLLTWEGKTVAVLDGDTIDIIQDGRATRIRLAGIDAPEKSQAYGQAAKKLCAELCFGKSVKVVSTEKDRYGRTIADVYVDKIWVNKKLIEEGLAWHYKKYSSSVELSAAEQKAKAEKLRLWKDADPVAPWDFRKKLE